MQLEDRAERALLQATTEAPCNARDKHEIKQLRTLDTAQRDSLDRRYNDGFHVSISFLIYNLPISKAKRMSTIIFHGRIEDRLSTGHGNAAFTKQC